MINHRFKNENKAKNQHDPFGLATKEQIQKIQALQKQQKILIANNLKPISIFANISLATLPSYFWLGIDTLLKDQIMKTILIAIDHLPIKQILINDSNPLGNPLDWFLVQAKVLEEINHLVDSES